MLLRWALLAEEEPRRPSLTDPALLWATFALVAALLFAALVIAWFDRWRKRPAEIGASPAEQMASFKESYERGEISQQEYERIRNRLAPKLRKQLNLPDRSPNTVEAPKTEPPANQPDKP